MDKQILKDQIWGFEAKITELRSQERQHIKVQTLVEQIEKSRVALDSFETEIAETKAKKGGFKTEKTLSLSDVAGRIGENTTKFLPSGEAVFQIDEDGLYIGLRREAGTTPYLSLSGGERAFFDLALCRALIGNEENNILVAEVAEVDSEKLAVLLQSISELAPKNQIILNTCHELENYPGGWNVVRLD